MGAKISYFGDVSKSRVDSLDNLLIFKNKEVVYLFEKTTSLLLSDHTLIHKRF